MNTNNTWYIIANPAAGGGKVEKKWPSIQQYLIEAAVDFEIIFTNRKEEAILLVQKAIKNGFRKIIGIGGDGTNNEIINGILTQTTVPSRDIQYTLLSMGTGNDWIKTHKIPRDISSWIKYLKKNNLGYQDVGLVKFHKDGKLQERYFANVAGLAYDAYLVKSHTKTKSFFPSKITYLIQLLSSLISYKAQKATVRFNDEYVRSQFYSINIGICKYSGGGMQTVPHAVANDGFFALTLFGNVSKTKIVLNTFRLYNGTVHKLKAVTAYKTKLIHIEKWEEDKVDLEVDGEYIGGIPAQFQLMEKALCILLP